MQIINSRNKTSNWSGNSRWMMAYCGWHSKCPDYQSWIPFQFYVDNLNITSYQTSTWHSVLTCDKRMLPPAFFFWWFTYRTCEAPNPSKILLVFCNKSRPFITDQVTIPVCRNARQQGMAFFWRLINPDRTAVVLLWVCILWFYELYSWSDEPVC